LSGYFVCAIEHERAENTGNHDLAIKGIV